MDEIETNDILKIFQQFGIYRNSLSKEHNDFVKQQLQKNYDVVIKTYELQGRTYTGTFREDSHRKENKIAYEKEAKLATVLASMGFDLEIRTTLMIKLLYVRFSKSIPSEKKNYAYATSLKLENLNIDCVHDNGKKWSGMNTFIRVMTM